VNGYLEFVLRSILIGCGATLVMDAWAWLLRRLGIPSMSVGLLGRWLGHFPQGRWRHESIARAAPVRGERWLGGCAHYAIGVAFAALLLAICGLGWAHAPSLAPALWVGVVTVLAPWLLLQPAFGAGIASSKTSAPLFNAGKSLVTHTVFGAGLYLAGLLVAKVWPVSL